MKRILPYILSCILLVYLIIVFTFVATKSGEVTCRGVRVAVKNTDVNVFVDEEDVMKAIKKGYGDIMDKSILAVNKDSLERVLVKNPMIKSVNIQQREPVLRVLTGEGYYVDRDGRVMPLSSKFTSRVVVATGDINKKFACEKLGPFAMKLKNEPFWDAYIEQLVVRSNEDVVMIPKVGDFRIVLGKVDDCDARLEKLILFLKDGITKKGWNRYKEINLKFDNQVVCVRK